MRFIKWLLILLCGISPSLAANATINSSVKNSSATPATTITANFTVGGSNRVLYAMVFSGDGSPANPSAVKWGGSSGTSLTQVGTTIDVGPYWKASLWRLIAPTATTADLYVSWGGTQDERLLIGVAVQDANQVTPNGTVTQNGVNNSGNIGINATAVVGDLTLGFGAFGDEGQAFSTMSATSSQTIAQKIDGGTGTGYECLGVGSIVATSTSQAHNWSNSAAGSGLVSWGAFAFAVNYSPGGGSSYWGAFGNNDISPLKFGL